MSFTPRLPDYLRFEVFKRDGFKCQYCGFSPDSRGFFRSILVLIGAIFKIENREIIGHPQNCLEVDHIEPRCEGGKDEIENLITACKRCNGGKWGVRLDRKILSIRNKRILLGELREILEEIEQDEQVISEIQKRIWIIKRGRN